MIAYILLCLTDEANNNMQTHNITGSTMISILVMLKYLSVEVAMHAANTLGSTFSFP